MLNLTGALLERQTPVPEVVRRLRTKRFDLSESIAALINAGGMTPADARTAVVDSATWDDLHGRSETYREHHEWIDPHALLEKETVDRMAGACGREPRILEAWITSDRITQAD